MRFHKTQNIFPQNPCINNGFDGRISDIPDTEIKNDTIVLRKQFVHKNFEERLAEYNGEITVCDFDWSEPMGREIL